MNIIVFSDMTRKLRKNAGYTQEEISTILHVCRQTYNHYETASRTPSLETLVLLSDFYQVSLDYLLRGREYQHTSSEKTPLTPMTRKMLRDFAKLPEEFQQEALDFVHFKLYLRK